jgi:hypothetical protein
MFLHQSIQNILCLELTGEIQWYIADEKVTTRGTSAVTVQIGQPRTTRKSTVSPRPVNCAMNAEQNELQEPAETDR